MTKAKEVIDPKLVDDVVDEIVSELKKTGSSGQKTMQTTIPQSELASLKAQLEIIQKSFDIDETEIERQVTEKFEQLSTDMESQITRLEGQISDLRTAMIRLSGELRKMKEGTQQV